MGVRWVPRLRSYSRILAVASKPPCGVISGGYKRGGRRLAYHDGHLYVHQNDIKLPTLDRFHGFLAVTNDRHDVMVLFENLHSKPLVDSIVLGKQDLKGASVIRQRRGGAVLESRHHSVAEIDQLAGRRHVRRDAQVKARFERDVNDRRQENDGQVLKVIDRPESAGVLDRVNDDDVVGRVSLLPRLLQCRALLRIDDNRHQAQTLEHLSDGGPMAGPALVDKQHLVTLVGAELLGDQGDVIVGQTDDAGEVEAAALAVLALDPDIATHEVDEALRDGKTQSGATKFARHGAVGLLERVENEIKLVRRDSYARIGNNKLNRILVRSAMHLSRLLDREADLAMLGELDGVAHEVENDLAQSERVSHYVVGYRAVHAIGQIEELFVCFHRERFECVEDGAAQCVGYLLDDHAPRFNLGQIQDVVDDG